MADLSPVAASVVATSGYSYIDVVAGASIVRGNLCYLNASNQAALVQADGTVTEATIAGVALNDAATGQPIRLQTGGSITIGATVAKGTLYGASATAGAIAPSTDIVTTGYYRSILGIASTTGIITLNIWNTGITLP